MKTRPFSVFALITVSFLLVAISSSDFQTTSAEVQLLSSTPAATLTNRPPATAATVKESPSATVTVTSRKPNVPTGNADWTRIGPYGGFVSALAIDSQTPSTIYAGTQYRGGGVFKSTNGGANWNWSWLNSDLTSDRVYALAIDPQLSSTIYAGTTSYYDPSVSKTFNGGVFKSTNGGASWSAVNSGLANTDIYALAIDPQTPSTIYAGTDGGVFKTTNGGVSWSAINSGLTDTMVRALAIDPQTPSTVYAGTYSGGVFKSTNGGANWSGINTGLTPNYVSAFAIDPQAPSTIYAGTLSGVFKTTNGGTSWTAISSGLTNTRIRALAIDPQTPSTIYAGTDGGGVFKSTNGGVSWTAINNSLANPSIWKLAVDPQTPSTIYAGTAGGGVFKSTNGGTSWNVINSGLANTDIYAVAIDPQTPTIIYAATFYSDGGVYKTTNGDASWTVVNSGLTNIHIYALAVDPQTPATVYAGTETSGVFKSTNGGANWSAINIGLTNTRIRALAIDPQTPSTIYAGTDGGVFKSTNGGASWINSGLTNAYVSPLAIDPQTPSTIYAGLPGNGGLAKSTNGGASWMGTGLQDTTPLALAIDPQTPSTIYAGTTDGGVSKTTDGGTSWISSGLTNLIVDSLAVDPQKPSTIYVGTFGSVFKTTNGGASWTAINNGLTNDDIKVLAIDPQTPSRVYAGTGGGGVFVDNQTPTFSASVAVSTSGHLISSYVQDNASLPIRVQVTNSTNGSPIQGVLVSLSNGNTLLGTTNSNGTVDVNYQMPSVPSSGDFVTEVIAQVNGQNFSSGAVTLYHADLLAGEPMIITQDEASNYTNALLYHYATRPGVPCPGALCRVLKLLDLLAKIVLQQRTYTPQVGDIATAQVYRYSAQGVTPVYLYFESAKRGSNTIFTYAKWTEDITQVQPFISARGVARNALVMQLASPATALVTDPTGKHAGFDPNTGSFVFDIPVAVSNSGEEPYFLLIPAPAIGQYTFQLTGTANGTYTMGIKTQNAQGQASTIFQTTTQITQGSTHTYSITYNPLSLYLPVILRSQ